MELGSHRRGLHSLCFQRKRESDAGPEWVRMTERQRRRRERRARRGELRARYPDAWEVLRARRDNDVERLRLMAQDPRRESAARSIALRKLADLEDADSVPLMLALAASPDASLRRSGGSSLVLIGD